mmetsp:Transcript_22936/g.54247  ORF Transcript_22936/g.54247 Transcript_22936/m.54247 type:complete len:201 (+) Transcript_22936:166-768(+)
MGIGGARGAGSLDRCRFAAKQALRDVLVRVSKQIRVGHLVLEGLKLGSQLVLEVPLEEENIVRRVVLDAVGVQIVSHVLDFLVGVLSVVFREVSGLVEIDVVARGSGKDVEDVSGVEAPTASSVGSFDSRRGRADFVLRADLKGGRADDEDEQKNAERSKASDASFERMLVHRVKKMPCLYRFVSVPSTVVEDATAIPCY